MNNSLVNVYLHVLRGFRKDFLLAYPALKGLDLDFERLALCCLKRGPTFFLLDLPNLDSLLCAGLETGRLELCGPLSKSVSHKTRVPRLFSGLWLRVFGKDACLRPEPDINAIAFLRQIFCFGKKVEVECSLERRKASLRSYHDVERVLRIPSNRWDSDKLRGSRSFDDYHLGDCLNCTGFPDLFESSDEERKERHRDLSLLDRVQQVADLISIRLGFFEPVRFSADRELESQGIGFKHGPGAVSDKKKNHEKSFFNYWPNKLENWFPYELCGRTASQEVTQVRNHELASRLIMVPKTAKTPRLIAAEPSQHQWCQQSMWAWLSERLKFLFGENFICFQKQSLSGDMVIQASLDRELATVDLSDASDRLSCWTVERIFRKNSSVLSALHAARTRYLLDDCLGDRTFIKLKKFASQGTATTFPVQSIVFLCISLASAIEGKVTWSKIMKLSDQVRVFGDDIIIPSRGYVRLNTIMTHLQLKVNTAKSYVSGNFRESCGVDGYKGYDVTPLKPKTFVADGPASCMAVIDTTNNLFNKGYWHASAALIETIPFRVKSRTRIVHAREAGYTGFTSYSGSDESHLKQRWNKRFHRYEVSVWGILPQRTNGTRDGGPVLLDFFSSRRSPDRWGFAPPRVSSEFRQSIRRTRSGSLWEPALTSSSMDKGLPR